MLTLCHLLVSFSFIIAFGDGPTCDDDVGLWDANGRPNPECTIEGCSVGEPLCWPDRLDHCYDAAGSDNGTCSFRDEQCKSSLGCYGLYLTCVGEWSCEESHWWGCSKGLCTEADSESENQAV